MEDLILGTKDDNRPEDDPNCDHDDDPMYECPVFSTDTFNKDSSLASSRRSSQASLHSNMSAAASPRTKTTATFRHDVRPGTSRIPGPCLKRSQSSLPRPTTPSQRKLGSKGSRDHIPSLSGSVSSSPSSLPRRIERKSPPQSQAPTPPSSARGRSATVHTNRNCPHKTQSSRSTVSGTAGHKLSHDSLRDTKSSSLSTPQLGPRKLSFVPSRTQGSTLPRIRNAASAETLGGGAGLAPRKSVGVNIKTRKLSDRIQDLQSSANASASVKPSAKTIVKPIGSPASAAKAVLNKEPATSKVKLNNRQSMRMLNGEDFATRRKRIQQAIADAGSTAEAPSMTSRKRNGSIQSTKSNASRRTLSRDIKSTDVKRPVAHRKKSSIATTTTRTDKGKDGDRPKSTPQGNQCSPDDRKPSTSSSTKSSDGNSTEHVLPGVVEATETEHVVPPVNLDDRDMNVPADQHQTDEVSHSLSDTGNEQVNIDSKPGMSGDEQRLSQKLERDKETDPPEEETSQPQTQEGVAKEAEETIESPSRTDSTGSVSIPPNKPGFEDAVSPPNLPEIIHNDGHGDRTWSYPTTPIEVDSPHEQPAEIDSSVPPKTPTTDSTTNDKGTASSTTMKGDRRRDSAAQTAQISPSINDSQTTSDELSAKEDGRRQLSSTSLSPGDMTSDNGSAGLSLKAVTTDPNVDISPVTAATSVDSSGRLSSTFTDGGSLSSYATASGRSHGEDDDSFVTPRESVSSDQAHNTYNHEGSVLSITKGDHNDDHNPCDEDEKSTISPQTRPSSPNNVISVDSSEEIGPFNEKKEEVPSIELPPSPKNTPPREDSETPELAPKSKLRQQPEISVSETNFSKTTQDVAAEDGEKKKTQMTVESGLKIEDAIAGRSGVPEREGFPIAQIVIKEDEEDDMNGVCTESSPKQPNGSIGQTGKVNDHEKEQLLKKRRSQIFQQTMSRRSEEHEREPMPPNVVDAISAAQRQLHRPSKRWTVVSRESSVVSDALSILSHSRRQSISSRKGEDLTTSGTGTSPKSHRILSRRHSKQSSEDSTSNLCLSEHDERRSTDTNDLDADPFDDRDASNVVLPYSNESSMHVLQQHYPEICLTDTNKVQQEKASKRMTQLFLSELSNGGFDTTLLTRPELNTGRHSINRFRLSQHRRKDSDISWTSHEHDNASIGTQESFDHRGDNQQLNAEPRLSIHEAPLETPRTLHNFKNAHPEHAELGIPIELGSPTSFTLPLTRDRSSHADSFRSSLTRPRSGSIDLTISPTRSPPTPPPPSSPTPQRSCSPSIMSSMAGVSSRRSSLLSVSSSNRTYIDGLANQLNQNYQLQFPSRKNEDLEATKHTSRMSSINEQGLAPTEITASTRYSGSTLRDKRTSTRDADYKRLKQRRNIIKELIDTEHRFTQDMTIVVEFYMHTAPSCSGMTPENTKTLFGNADKVFQFTTMFQDELKHAARSVYSLPHSQRYQSKRAGSRPSSSMDMNNGNGTVELSDENDRKTTIGMAFMSYAQRMEEVYAEYLKNHDSANKMLDMLQKREVVQLWLTECKGLAVGLTDAWDLDSLLVKPVQRMLKYPLLLTELLSVTPQDHPDYVNLQSALKETTSISVRINESKKRADVVGQVIHSSTRRRRESDVRAGLTKAFTWRGDKHKHHAERYNDHEFDLLANQFGENFFHTSLIIRDVDDYIIKVQRQVQKFYAYVTSINAFVESHEAQNQKPERKWHKFAKTVKHLMDKALTEHIAAVRKGVSQPMYQLLKLHDGPQRVMQKRNKRYIDYTRYRYIQDRHEKPDRKTVEQAEQFDALNITLKEELPRLFKLSAKLMRELLGVFGHLQAVWNLEMQSRLSYILGNSIDYMPGEDLRLISDHWAEKFNPSEKLVTALSICNGTLLADNVTGLSLGPAAQIGHSGRPSTMSNIYLPTGSSMTQTSPKYSQDQSSRSRSSSNLFSKVDLSMSLGNSSSVSRVYTPATTYSPTLSPSDHQLRGSETCRGSSGADVPQLPPIAPLPPLPTTTSSISALPGLSLTVPSTGDAPMRTPRLGISQPLSAASSTNFLNSPVPMRAPSPQPDTNSQTHRQASTVGSSGSSLVDFKSIFPVISLCPFDIEPNRIANGYPYLSYKAGEAFGVVGEKGDLWLAWNEADPSHTVGWIWTKHFEKVQH